MDAPRVEIAFEDLSYTVKMKKGKRTLLSQVTAKIEAGKLTAIMGPSGAGKTTLLNALSGRLPRTGKKLYGKLLVNSEPVSFDQIRKLAGYVMQDDVMLNELTPRELITFSINMTSTANAQEKKARVKDVIQKLRLTKCANTPVGIPGIRRGISGGERKRTSIAVELVNNPGTLFLDEPTSGLDSETAAQVMEILAKLAHEEGHTIACTIHQPSSEIFHLFDNLILLNNGKLEYFGSVAGAKSHFAKKGFFVPSEVNPADYYLKVLSQMATEGEAEESSSISKRISSEVVQSSQYDVEMEMMSVSDSKDNAKLSSIITLNDADTEKPSTTDGGARGDWKAILKSREKKTGLLAQQMYLIKRSYQTYTRNKLATLGKFFQYIGVILFASLLNYHLSDMPRGITNKVGYLFSKVMLFSFMPANGVVLQFPVERPVFMREYAKGMYHPFLYFLSKNLIETPFQLSFVILTAWDYFVVGFDLDASEFFKVLLVYCLVSLIGSSIGLVVGAGISDVGQGMEIAPALIIPQMLVGGLFIYLKDIPNPFVWLADISFIRWAFEGAMVAVFSNPNEINCNSHQLVTQTCTGHAVLEAFDFTNSFGVCIAVLIAIVIVLRTFAYVILHAFAWWTAADG